MTDRLWTPWRYAYVSNADDSRRQGVAPGLEAWPGDLRCVFCNLLASTEFAVKNGMSPVEADRLAGIVARGQWNFICLNAFPYNSGHIMVVPNRHEGELGALLPSESGELMEIAQQSDRVLRRTYEPDGMNLGMNLGKAAGAGVAGHLHLHVVPRWAGDTNFMTVAGETRVLPETLDITWRRLHEGFHREADAQERGREDV